MHHSTFTVYVIISGYTGSGVAIEEVGRVHIPHLVQLGVADFTEKWAVLFTEAPKELPDRLDSLKQSSNQLKVSPFSD